MYLSIGGSGSASFTNVTLIACVMIGNTAGVLVCMTRSHSKRLVLAHCA